LIDFTIIAFVIFMIIKGINKAKNKEEETPKVPPATPIPSAQEVLLTEIRDLLKSKE
jgi:large conductance mechanosensitive channel